MGGTKVSISREDRIKGVLLGQAAGDALGVHYETGIPSHGKADMLGGGYGFEPGEYSDDTQQAVIIAASKSNAAKVAAGLLTWYRSNPPDVGPTASRTLGKTARDMQGQSMKEAAGVMQDAARFTARGRQEGAISNGSLMRCGPTCLPFLGDRAKVAKVARELSDLTHFDPYAGDACVLWSLAIEAAIMSPNDMQDVDVEAGVAFLPAERQAYWRETIRRMTEPSAIPPSSNLNVRKAFEAALWAVSHHHDYESTMQGAIAIGGDTDTIAAIAGALAGAIYGASTIPQDWLRLLHGWSLGDPRIWARDLEQLALDAAGVS